MRKFSTKHFFICICFLSAWTVFAHCKTVIFYEKNFPSIENGQISRQSLEKAFSSFYPVFVDLPGLQNKNTLTKNDLLILPYGSAFPAEAWETINRHLSQGDVLIIGGRPLYIPVYRKESGWRIDFPQNTFSRSIGIEHSYEAPQKGPWKIQWDESVPLFLNSNLDAHRVFVNAGAYGKYRGIGFFVNDKKDRLACPVTAEDIIGFNQTPRRRIYLSFDAGSEFWNSGDGIELMKKAALYASYGGCRLWIDLQQLTVAPGEYIAGSINVLRSGRPANLTVELFSGSKLLRSETSICTNTYNGKINFPVPLNNPGLYKIRASLSIGDTLFEQYSSGIFVRDTALIHSGETLECGKDFFRLDGKPYLLCGTNYFSTDAYTGGFFYGGSLGGNALVWDNDFNEMANIGLTIVRTGIWVNRGSYLSWVTGAPDEKFLNALEAYLIAAARHHMQVIFTFFAFEPQTEMQGQGQDSPHPGQGSNPYLDPVAIDAQLTYIRTITSRFKDVPFLSYDIINEPSFCNPKRLWRGNSPNGDPIELSAWQNWLKKRYENIDGLAHAWKTPPSELGSFEKVQLPSFSDLDFSRSDNLRNTRAIDYNLFAQDSFIKWLTSIIQGIRSTGVKQVITVGQDEGGVADRLLNQFWANSPVNYTVNHSWYRDDALLWNSLAAKTLGKPNIIGETGPQPVSSMDGSWRLDEINGLALLERKLALGFACSNSGVLHWDWTRTDNFGILRRDGSQKQWMDVLKGIAKFAADAKEYATGSNSPEIALVLPQSLQFSMFSGWSIETQQNAVRVLYQYARHNAFAVGEYQLSQMPNAKLIIVPSPWIITQDAWNTLLSRVKNGSTLLISGRIDADEHWISIPGRSNDLNLNYKSTLLTSREVLIKWPGGTSHLTYPNDKTTYAERGLLADNKSFADIKLGKGRILYFTVPLEESNQLNEIGRIYQYAIKEAGITASYETDCSDPGILICPTQLPEATLYVLTSESADIVQVKFKDRKCGSNFTVNIEPGRAVLLLINRNGEIITSYNYH